MKTAAMPSGMTIEATLAAQTARAPLDSNASPIALATSMDSASANISALRVHKYKPNTITHNHQAKFPAEARTVLDVNGR